MPQFQLDTAGTVEARATVVTTNPTDYPQGLAFGDLDAFTQGYIEALFFTETEAGTDAESHDPENESALHGECGFSDLAPDSLASIIDDCEAFQRENAALLAEAYTRDYDAEQAGRDYWFTRNGHGVGFWDRDALKPQGAEWDALQRPLDTWSPAESATYARLKAESLGERLSGACRRDSVDAYLGDDGKVYLA